ncbi:hypothetical protein GGTG_13603 [Gaeumannomyces tritici R3-111a-1]|uniref:Uncharacterized protein n=1 Tax=Gaeumannomyces tritici (strain R3-111a-1) TaxID=644352 RepID=J3PJC4_GAET3|nr:hypothetical protein GGTG_13603 [Gaeumannomyces tritici R3-111a-1]EJT68825.1 hypothetical protein GGTG_13603 [Gaeumannomyces tritici R3-111a-1]
MTSKDIGLSGFWVTPTHGATVLEITGKKSIVSGAPTLSDITIFEDVDVDITVEGKEELFSRVLNWLEGIDATDAENCITPFSIMSNHRHRDSETNNCGIQQGQGHSCGVSKGNLDGGLGVTKVEAVDDFGGLTLPKGPGNDLAESGVVREGLEQDECSNTSENVDTTMTSGLVEAQG